VARCTQNDLFGTPQQLSTETAVTVPNGGDARVADAIVGYGL
jgi:hypothetical protein